MSSAQAFEFFLLFALVLSVFGHPTDAGRLRGELQPKANAASTLSLMSDTELLDKRHGHHHLPRQGIYRYEEHLEGHNSRSKAQYQFLGSERNLGKFFYGLLSREQFETLSAGRQDTALTDMPEEEFATKLNDFVEAADPINNVNDVIKSNSCSENGATCALAIGQLVSGANLKIVIPREGVAFHPHYAAIAPVVGMKLLSLLCGADDSEVRKFVEASYLHDHHPLNLVHAHIQIKNADVGAGCAEGEMTPWLQKLVSAYIAGITPHFGEDAEDAVTAFRDYMKTHTALGVVLRNPDTTNTEHQPDWLKAGLHDGEDVNQMGALPLVAVLPMYWGLFPITPNQNNELDNLNSLIWTVSGVPDDSKVIQLFAGPGHNRQIFLRARLNPTEVLPTVTFAIKGPGIVLMNNDPFSNWARTAPDTLFPGEQLLPYDRLFYFDPSSNGGRMSGSAAYSTSGYDFDAINHKYDCVKNWQTASAFAESFQWSVFAMSMLPVPRFVAQNFIDDNVDKFFHFPAVFAAGASLESNLRFHNSLEQDGYRYTKSLMRTPTNAGKFELPARLLLARTTQPANDFLAVKWTEDIKRCPNNVQPLLEIWKCNVDLLVANNFVGSIPHNFPVRKAANANCDAMTETIACPAAGEAICWPAKWIVTSLKKAPEGNQWTNNQARGMYLANVIRMTETDNEQRSFDLPGHSGMKSDAVPYELAVMCDEPSYRTEYEKMVAAHNERALPDAFTANGNEEILKRSEMLYTMVNVYLAHYAVFHKDQDACSNRIAPSMEARNFGFGVRDPDSWGLGYFGLLSTESVGKQTLNDVCFARDLRDVTRVLRDLKHTASLVNSDPVYDTIKADGKMVALLASVTEIATALDTIRAQLFNLCLAGRTLKQGCFQLESAQDVGKQACGASEDVGIAHVNGGSGKRLWPQFEDGWNAYLQSQFNENDWDPFFEKYPHDTAEAFRDAIFPNLEAFETKFALGTATVEEKKLAEKDLRILFGKMFTVYLVPKLQQYKALADIYSDIATDD